MATATKNEMIKSDVIVPESDLAAMIAIDETSKACADQLIKVGSNQAAKALVTARAIRQLKELLTDEVMKDIMVLMNSPLGFRTDRPNKTDSTYYKLEVVRECVLQALLRGIRVVGNEFNIIAGNLYVTKEGFERLLADLPGLTNLKTQVGVPQNFSEGSLVPARAEWDWQGVHDEMIWEEKETGDYRIPVRVNGGMGVDAVLGKAKSKIARNIYARITGTKLAVEDEAEDVVPATKVAATDGKLFKDGESAGHYEGGH